MSTAQGPQGPGGEQNQWGGPPPGQWGQPGPQPQGDQWPPPPAQGGQWAPPQAPQQQGAQSPQQGWGQPPQQGQWGQPGPQQWPQPQQQWGQPQQPWAQGSAYGTPPDVPRPKSIDLAVLLMRIGAGLALLGIPLAFLLKGDIDQAVRDELARQQSTAPKGAEPLPPELMDFFINGALVMAAVSGLIGVGLWLWMAWANKQGKKWARITATVFFGIAVFNSLTNLLGQIRPPVISMVLQALSLLVGAAAVFFMWKKESSPYYESRSRRY